ncbi:hypothetical protein BYT27DRAFT_7264695 [Phlegmacium glaucopus]|nr:hypothetical protein BYT27DRAFT_7264695 [Phlegmacium glaucopus]
MSTSDSAHINTVTQMFAVVVHAFRQLGVSVQLGPEPGLSLTESERVAEIIVTALARMERADMEAPAVAGEKSSAAPGVLNVTEPTVDRVAGGAQVLNAPEDIYDGETDRAAQYKTIILAERNAHLYGRARIDFDECDCEGRFVMYHFQNLQ